MMKKLFGGGSKQQAPAAPPPSAPPPSFKPSNAASQTVDAIQKLGETEELLVKRRELLEKKIDAEMQRARQLTKDKNKKAALLALKKKKMYEQQLEQVENNILRINENQLMLESTSTQMETVGALHAATKASKQAMSDLNIDRVDKVLEEITETNDQLRMVQDALGAPLGPAAELDDDELLNELEEMEAEELDAELMKPAPVPTHKVPQEKLPSVPAAPAKTKEELELEALEAEMA